MHWLAASCHDANVVSRLRAHQNASMEEVTRVKAARRIDPCVAVVIDMPHIETNLIHMGTQQHACGRSLGACCSLAGADERAHRVFSDIVKEAPNRASNDLTNPLFPTRHAGCFTEPLKQFLIHRRGTVPATVRAAEQGVYLS